MGGFILIKFRPCDAGELMGSVGSTAEELGM